MIPSWMFATLIACLLPLLASTIVNWETGYETWPWKRWCCNLCWKGRACAQSLVLMFTLQLNILSGTFLLVSYCNTLQNLLWFVHGQSQICLQKRKTKTFVMLHNHCLLLAMLLIMFTSLSACLRPCLLASSLAGLLALLTYVLAQEWKLTYFYLSLSYGECKKC